MAIHVLEVKQRGSPRASWHSARVVAWWHGVSEVSMSWHTCVSGMVVLYVVVLRNTGLVSCCRASSPLRWR